MKTFLRNGRRFNNPVRANGFIIITLLVLLSLHLLTDKLENILIAIASLLVVFVIYKMITIFLITPTRFDDFRCYRNKVC